MLLPVAEQPRAPPRVFRGAGRRRAASLCAPPSPRRRAERGCLVASSSGDSLNGGADVDESGATEEAVVVGELREAAKLAEDAAFAARTAAGAAEAAASRAQRALEAALVQVGLQRAGAGDGQRSVAAGLEHAQPPEPTLPSGNAVLSRATRPRLAAKNVFFVCFSQFACLTHASNPGPRTRRAACCPAASSS